MSDKNPPEPTPDFGSVEPPTPASGASSRLIRRHGLEANIYDKYLQYAGEDALNEPLYDTKIRLRASVRSVIQTSEEFARDFLVTGPQQTGKVLAFFEPLGRDGEPVIHGEQTDVPADEQLPGGKDPSKDKYDPSIIEGVRNERFFTVESVTVEGSSVRRVLGSLRGPVEGVEAKPVAKIAISPNKQTYTFGRTVYLYPYQSTTKYGYITAHEWTLPDGSVSNDSQITWDLQNVGSVTFKLEVTNSAGLTDTVTKTIDVTP